MISTRSVVWTVACARSVVGEEDAALQGPAFNGLMFGSLFASGTRDIPHRRRLTSVPRIRDFEMLHSVE